MTRRKPLVWYGSELGLTPDCGDCLEYLFSAPMLREGCASIAIEKATTGDALLKRVIDKYHADGHKEMP